MSRPLRLLMVHPGASWSTHDVFCGLYHGLEQHGVDLIPYRLDERLSASHKWLHVYWRQQNKVRKATGQPALQKPMQPDVVYHAGVGVLEMALRTQADVVLAVSGMLLHPDVVVMMKRAGLKVVVLFTESPYDQARELEMAKQVDGCWTQERTSVVAFREVNANSGYLAHGWHPQVHRPSSVTNHEVPRHDVVFVGSGFSERITFFNSIDWEGIDLGLYGTWDDLGLKPQAQACVKGANIENSLASSLYRHAKIGLNLYRTKTGIWGMRELPTKVNGESLRPRAYELAACGVFSLSAYRAEVPEVFGDLVPTFRTPQEAEALIRAWLPKAQDRIAVASQLPACVAEMSWTARAAQVLGDLETLLAKQRAA